MFRAVSLPIIRSYPLYIRHWHMLYRFDDSQLGWNCPKHVEFRTGIILEISESVGFYCKEICYDARSYERKSFFFFGP